MDDSYSTGKLHESCDDCEWEDYWNGGTATEDPGLAHARKTGHTVTGRVAGNYTTGSDHAEQE